MLYIFHVDTGTTITFDIKLALENVSQLKEAIERECGVVASEQVLLMSGGESLEPNARVCSYSAGTDTNPIYLFSKAAIESHLPPTPSIDYGSDVDLQSQIDGSLAMPATYQTVVARAQLAQQCWGLAREQTRICERLVHDQHLQQQGWAAVVANLEDITQMFQSKATQLQQSFSVYLSERQQHMQLLEKSKTKITSALQYDTTVAIISTLLQKVDAHSFSADLGTLAKIPILPGLRAQAEGLLSPEDQPSQSEKEPKDRDEVLSLLRWISAKDNQSSLEQVAEQCSRGLEQFDERVLEALKAEVNAAIDATDKQEMKEIKGLGERLFALEQLMQQTKKLVQEQGELAQGFLQNQSRANNLGDASVFPDLCTSHRRQLLVMLQNHNQLRDIRRRCTKAKEELSVNIYHRLKWIMYVENKMMEVGNKLVMYSESLKRLRRHLDVLQQIHLAPQMYMNAVAEVVRRRTFSQAFLVWASGLACQLLTVHSEELARRREFQSKFDGHFLKTLFPGLEDTPPPFATQAPSVFDNELPKLTVDDMESLKSQLPDTVFNISTPDLNSITQFFLSKSLTEGSSDGNKEKESTSMRIDVPAKEQEQTKAPMLVDRGGFESETDTEEFEKISQGAAESKPSSFEGGVKQVRQKQLEVGASRSVSPASSTSTNVSPLNSKAADLTARSSSSSEPGSFHFPSLSASERPPQLSPLAECAENGHETSNQHVKCRELSSTSIADPTTAEGPSSLSPNPEFLKPESVMCDGQQSQQQADNQHHNHQHHHQLSGSGGSSPSIGVGGTEFVGTEFYMDESLPSSLSEHPVDGQHQAIVSLLQENLGNTREEVEKLRSILKTMRAVVCESLTSVREELAVLRGQSAADKNSLSEMTERLREALSLYSSECDRRLREREQELTVDHELQMVDLKKLIQNRMDEISTLKRCLLEKQTELEERDRYLRTMKQKLEVVHRRSSEARLDQDLETVTEQARTDKQPPVEEPNDEKFLEITSLNNSVTQCSKTMQKLDECSNSAERRISSDDTGEMQLERKGRPESLTDRLKRIATLSIKKSDSAVEKIEETIRRMTSAEHLKNATFLMESGLHKELEDKHLEVSQSGREEVLKALEDKDDAEASESKKVRLEETDDAARLSRRLEILENDNLRLTTELLSVRESKQAAEAKVEALEAEKVNLVVELVKERSRRHFSAPESSSSSEGREKEMNVSVSAVAESGPCQEVSFSPELTHHHHCDTIFYQCVCKVQKMIRPKALVLAELDYITITSCNPGDVVLLFWDSVHNYCIVYQESLNLYFVNSESLAALDPEWKANGNPARVFTMAVVVDKDYCHAKKSKNRYHVPQGTKFYRVRVKPMDDNASMKSHLHESLGSCTE